MRKQLLCYLFMTGCVQPGPPPINASTTKIGEDVYVIRLDGLPVADRDVEIYTRSLAVCGEEHGFKVVKKSVGTHRRRLQGSVIIRCFDDRFTEDPETKRKDRLKVDGI